MTDLRTLLHDAAPRPTAALDIDAVVAVATRRRVPWRRLGLWFGGIAVAAGLTGGTVGVLSPATTTEVDTAPPPSEQREVHVPRGDVEDQVPLAAGPRNPAASTTTTAAGTAASSDGAEWKELGSPPAEGGEGCHVDAGGTGVVAPKPLVGGAGDDDMSADRCGYVARERGGYRAAGTWSVTIERDGQRITYAHDLGSPDCADDVIRPGDVVTVSVRTAGATADGEVHAGPDVGCG